MSNVVDFEEIKFGKAILKEVPPAIKALDTCMNLLYTHSKYVDIMPVILEIKTSKLMLELTLEAYKTVLKEAGVKSE